MTRTRKSRPPSLDRPDVPDDPFAPARRPQADRRGEKAEGEGRPRAKDHDKKIADGKKRVEELTDRFADWYYVTPGDSFRSIELDRNRIWSRRRRRSRRPDRRRHARVPRQPQLRCPVPCRQHSLDPATGARGRSRPPARLCVYWPGDRRFFDGRDVKKWAAC